MSCRHAVGELGARRVLRFRCSGCEHGASIEGSETCMREVVLALSEMPDVDAVILEDLYQREYTGEDLNALKEVALALAELRRFSLKRGDKCGRCDRERNELLTRLKDSLACNPSRARGELEQTIAGLRPRLERGAELCKRCRGEFVQRLGGLFSSLSRLKLAEKCGDELLRPLTRPCFLTPFISVEPPPGAELADAYELDGGEVRIYRSGLQRLYFLTPLEYALSSEHVALLHRTRQALLERGRGLELELTRARGQIEHLGADLLAELAAGDGLELGEREIKTLAGSLARFTAGLGILETLLSDARVQDIYVDAPVGRTPIHLYHRDFEECLTNVYLTPEDAEALSSRFRALSGRPFSESNPVLDLELDGVRVAAISSPLSPEGQAFSLRRHKPTPWTLPQFIEARFLTPRAAGLLSLLVDAQTSMLIAGCRAAGKTSLLGALMLEILPNFRILVLEDTSELPVAQLRSLGFKIQTMRTQSPVGGAGAELRAEDALLAALRMGESVLILGEVRSSVPGWEEVLVVENGIMKRIPIRELENKPINSFRVPTLDFDLRVKLKPLMGFVKHPPRKKLLEVITRTGRHITVTPDHSLFTAKHDFHIAPIECKNLKVGDTIVIPASIPVGFNDMDTINVLEFLPEFRVENFEYDTRRAIQKLGWKYATRVAGVTSGDIYNYFRTAPNQQINLPVKAFLHLMKEAKLNFDPSRLRVKRGNGYAIPALIPVNEEFCQFLGYYVSEGYIHLADGEGGSVVLTNSDPTLLARMSGLAQRLFGLTPKTRIVHGAGKSTQLQLHSSALATLLERLGCGRTCTKKRAPLFIFGLSRLKIAAFLRGLFSGDGCFTSSTKSGNSVSYVSTSKKLVEDVAYLLLAFNIVATIRKRIREEPNAHDQWKIEFKDCEMVRTFLREIGFEHKKPYMLVRAWQHSRANCIQFSREGLRRHLLRYPRKYRHLFRFQRCSKRYLRQVANDTACQSSEQFKSFANGEFFLDEVKEIREIQLREPVPVYDLSVEPSQNFIGGFSGVLLHNTEAKTLYEAMRIGATGNSVMGTIHGATARDVFERVVHDLGVPPSSFGATEAIVVASLIRPRGGVHRVRRVAQVAEVCGGSEGEFEDLMVYNPTTDELKSTPALSERPPLIQKIARKWGIKPKEVLQNLELRARVFEELVKTAAGLKAPQLLEATFTVRSNLVLHESLEKGLRGGRWNNRGVFERWRGWLAKEAEAWAG